MAAEKRKGSQRRNQVFQGKAVVLKQYVTIRLAVSGETKGATSLRELRPGILCQKKNKENILLLANWWSKYSFSSFVKFGHYEILEKNIDSAERSAE